MEGLRGGVSGDFSEPLGVFEYLVSSTLGACECLTGLGLGFTILFLSFSLCICSSSSSFSRFLFFTEEVARSLLVTLGGLMVSLFGSRGIPLWYIMMLSHIRCLTALAARFASAVEKT